MSKHTLSVLVENKPGVLARIAGLFSRRGFNIDSLAVGPTEHAEVSRMTIVVNVEESPLEQVTKQLNKLVEVIKIVELDGPMSVTRELLLVKVRADASTRGAVLDAVQLFRAKVVDVSPEAVTVQAVGNADKLAEAYGCVGLRCERPEDIDATIQKAMEVNDVPVVIDFVVHRDAMVWPMVAAGTSNDDIKFARDMAPVFEEDDL